MGYVYECRNCGMTLTAETEDRLVDDMIRHSREQHHLELAIENAKKEARDRAKTPPQT